MPTYEYSCKSCGEHLEVVQSFKDTALTECPNCGGSLRKVFGNIGIVFKGSGFYKNDSRSGRSSSVVPAAPSSSSSSEPAAGSSSETAPKSSPTNGSAPAKTEGTPAPTPPSSATASRSENSKRSSGVAGS
jgi:putative FmdB family regulatory protein